MSKELDPNVEALNADTTVVLEKNPRRKWQSYLWDSLNKSPKERKFLFKLDLALLTFACLGTRVRKPFVVNVTNISTGYFAKYLDQANLNNAFVSGMQVASKCPWNKLC